MNSKIIANNKFSEFYSLLEPQEFKLFDETVYDKNSKIRSAYANKTYYDPLTRQVRAEDRPFVIERGTFEQSVIGCFFDHDSIEIDDTDFETPALKAKESSTVQKKLKTSSRRVLTNL